MKISTLFESLETASSWLPDLERHWLVGHFRQTMSGHGWWPPVTCSILYHGIVRAHFKLISWLRANYQVVIFNSLKIQDLGLVKEGRLIWCLFGTIARFDRGAWFKLKCPRLTATMKFVKLYDQPFNSCQSIFAELGFPLSAIFLSFFPVCQRDYQDISLVFQLVDTHSEE